MKISILIPTKNEPLINELIAKIHRVLTGYNHEIIIIDKSNVPPKIKGAKLILQKSNGLGKAVIEGLQHVKGNGIIVMDGDFSHEPKYLPDFIEKLKEADIVIGSRYIVGGHTKDKFMRKIVSKVAIWNVKNFLGIGVEDPVSGFFAVRKKVFDFINLSPVGFKILVEILYKTKNKMFKVAEIPIIFNPRKKGESKFDFWEIKNFLNLLFSLRVGSK